MNPLFKSKQSCDKERLLLGQNVEKFTRLKGNTKAKQTQEKVHPILQREHEPRKIASSTETKESEASLLHKLDCGSKRLCRYDHLEMYDTQKMNLVVKVCGNT